MVRWKTLRLATPNHYTPADRHFFRILFCWKVQGSEMLPQPRDHRADEGGDGAEIHSKHLTNARVQRTVGITQPKRSRQRLQGLGAHDTICIKIKRLNCKSFELATRWTLQYVWKMEIRRRAERDAYIHTQEPRKFNLHPNRAQYYNIVW